MSESSKERAYTILLGPHISEKSARVGDQANNYVFKVLPSATKAQIRQAVEQVFGVRVEGVRTVNVKGKQRRTVHGMSRRKNWKKAYVRVVADQSIDFASVN